MADALATVGVPKFSVNAGYIYTTDNPFTEFDQPLPPPAGSGFYTPRNEVTVGASSRWEVIGSAPMPGATCNPARWSPPVRRGSRT